MTLMCCATADAGRGHQHREGCLVLAGWNFRCSCSGPYCGPECDGRFVSPDGETKISAAAALEASGGGDCNRPDVWDGEKHIPYDEVFAADGLWLGWPNP